MSSSYHTKNGHTSKRGAFINGIWHCDCEPRLPAEKFQTKNGGKNHGRWFFTCQKPQPKRCSFFLWSDDAKIREESAVISNSRTEPIVPTEPKTPKKQTTFIQPPTPSSRARSATISAELPRKQLWASAKLDKQGDESFSWSSSGDEELASVAEAVVNETEESPSNSAQTPVSSSPGKRKYTEMIHNSKPGETWPTTDNLFPMPTTPTKSSGLLSPIDSHFKIKNDSSMLPSSLSSEVLELLRSANLSSRLEQELVELLNRYDLRTQGIVRGRDITRMAVQAKDKKIAELQARITALEAEKETSRTVIAHLKQDIATSPKRTGRTRFGNRSEI